MLHEIMIEEEIDRKMDDKVKALHERIDDFTYITFKNERGEPLLIFCQTEAAITRINRQQNDIQQLLLQIGLSHYILTFSNRDRAKQFSDHLLKHLVTLFLTRCQANVRARFQDNRITMDS